MPYRSKNQIKFMHAVHPEIAAEWDEKYSVPRDLPTKVKKKMSTTDLDKSMIVTEDPIKGFDKKAMKNGKKVGGTSKSVVPKESGDRGITPEKLLSMAKKAGNTGSTIMRSLDPTLEKMPTVGKIYLRKGESGPTGARIFKGPRGGRYFNYTPTSENDKWLLDRRSKREKLKMPPKDTSMKEKSSYRQKPEVKLYKDRMIIDPGIIYVVRHGGDDNNSYQIGNILKKKDGSIIARSGLREAKRFATEDEAHDWLVQNFRKTQGVLHRAYTDTLTSANKLLLTII